MTTMAVVCFGLACLLAGLLIGAVLTIWRQGRDLDAAAVRECALIEELRRIESEQPEMTLDDHVRNAITLADEGIDLAGLDAHSRAALLIEHEDLTGEERDLLDEDFADLINRLSGGVPYVPGNDDTEEQR